MQTWRLGAVLLVITATAFRASADVVYVDVAAAGASSGLSWGDAFTNLQAGVNATGVGGEVWVREGSYGSVTQRTGIAVYGGFNGTESARESRNWNAHPTTLNGNGGRAVTAAQFSILDGFVITNTSGDGGAYYASRVNSALENCRIIGNTNGDAVQLLQVGANTGIGQTFIRHCVFYANHGTSIYYSGRTNNVVGPHVATVDSCLFVANTGATSGGGIRTENATSTFHVQNCIFAGNVATNGGAMYVSYSDHSDGTPVEVSHCTFYANQATLGKAIFLSFTEAELNVNNCIIWGAATAQIRLQNDDTTLNMGHCDIEGGTNAVSVKSGTFVDQGGNFNTPPGFLDSDGIDDVAYTLDDNYRLIPDSPCIDAAPSSDVNHDYDGNARPNGPGYDLGAFEISGALPHGLLLNVH